MQFILKTNFRKLNISVALSKFPNFLNPDRGNVKFKIECKYISQLDSSPSALFTFATLVN